MLLALIPPIHVVVNFARRRYSNLFPTTRLAITGTIVFLYCLITFGIPFLSLRVLFDYCGSPL